MIGAAILSAVAGLVLFRVRGGMWLGHSPHWLTRGLWALGMAIVVGIATHDIVACALTLPAFFIGTVLPWWHSIDLGRIEGNTASDYALNAIRGLCFTAGAGAVLWYLGLPWYAGLVGLLCPLCYLIGWSIPSRVKNFQQGPELGEAIFGALVGATFALTGIF